MIKHKQIAHFLSLKMQDIMWNQFIWPTPSSIISHALQGTWTELKASGLEAALKSELGQET